MFSKRTKIILLLPLLLIVFAAVNWSYQVIQNPAILIALFSGKKYKSSNLTWKSYHSLFKEHSTEMMTPEFLGAMAQVESAGNPLIIPPWRWRLTTNIFRIYAPASTSAGLYQYTKPTFQDAKRFCIHSHQVALKGPLLNIRSCWFNGLYSRFWPSHAIEMTSARLHYYVKKILRKFNKKESSIANQQKLAAIIHLCGVRKGERFAKSNFRFHSVPKCGSHRTQTYVNSILRIQKKYNSKTFLDTFF